MLHTFSSKQTLVFAACCLSLVACGDSEDGAPNEDAAYVAPADACPVVVSDADCDKSLRPIVFVHGTFGSGDNISLVASLFGSNGYCQDRFVAVEYNSVSLSALSSGPIDALDQLIDQVRMQTGQDQVELMGHSQGTGHCMNYLTAPEHAAKVAHYVNLSGTGTVANDVKTLSISSQNDIGGMLRHNDNAEKVVSFVDEDHMGLASSTRAFEEIYKYLVGKDPKYTEIQCGDEDVTIEGIAETFGDNEPIAGGKLEVFEASGDPQKRGAPIKVITSDEQGRTGAFTLKRLVPYEFRALDGSGNLIGHVYFTPFKRSNRLARFLGPSKNPLVSALTTDNLKRNPAHSVAVFRNAAGSFRADLGDSLTLDKQEVLSEAVAGKADTTVGLFVSDQNLNKKSDLGKAFEAPFVKGTDVYLPAQKPAWIHVDWNGELLRFPNWASDQGLISVFLM
jgi:pimeloyl-ACP methyl ester carboxylesterase